MKKMLFFVFIILLSLSFLIFNDKGNEIIKPYVSSYLENTLKKDTSVKVEHLKIDLNSIEFSAQLNNINKVHAQGDLSLFTQKLNLDYTIQSINNKIDINGTLIGNFYNMKIQGEGEALKSYVNYALEIKNDTLQNVNMSINKADITSLLQLFSQPAYAKGKLDIDINIPTFRDLSSEGNAKIILHPTTLNEKVFKKEFKIDLAKKTVITANIYSKINGKELELEGKIKSDLARLNLSNTTYNVNDKKLLANYVLNIPRLSQFMFLTKKKLNGKLKLNGQFKINDEKLNLIGTSNSLGGKTNFDYDGETLNTYLNNIEITKLLYLLNEKPYATGNMDAKLKLSNLKQVTGNFEVTTQTANTINHTLKKEFDLNFRKPIPFSLHSKGNIASNIVNIQSILKSDILTYTSNDLKYNLNTSTLTSSYQLDIPKLSKFNTIVGKPLKGKLSIDGEMNYNTNLIVTGKTQSLDGNIDFRLSDKKLTSKINNVPVDKLMDILSYPQVFKANLLGTFNYDLATHKGKFTATLNKTKLLSSELTLLIEQFRGLDLTRERYSETHFNATFTKNLIDIDFEAKNNKVLLAIPSGRINKANNSINATFNINIDNKDIVGKIQGDISNPEIVINSSKFIRDEMQNMIQDNMPNKAFNELGFGKKETNMMRDMMDSFF